MPAAAGEPKSGKAVNIYAAGKNDPALAERIAREQAELDAAVQAMLQRNPGRVPSWDAQRVMQMDRHCLEQGKRCVMWDDQGAGFYLLLNWDWVANRPTAPPSIQDAVQPGWWFNARQVLKAPLIDPDLPEDRLGAWLDERTMAVHHALLSRRDKLRRDPQTGALSLDDPYWQQLQALPPWLPAKRAAQLAAQHAERAAAAAAAGAVPTEASGA